MKGLVLTHMGRREEGLELVKKGVRLDLTSHIVWHVFGLVQKGEKNYEEALKSYTQALKFDKENMNILRDAAHLQTQLRQYDGLVETRHTLLRLRPNLRSNWLGLAVAYHLNGQSGEAKKVLDHYEVSLKNIPDYDVEHSEVLLYHVRVLEDLGELNEALNLLDVSAKSRAIIDRVAIMEFRARLLSKLSMNDDAEHTWQALIEQNPDHYSYYKGFLSNRGVDLDSITDETRPKALEVFKSFSTQLPRAAAPRRLALAIATGDDFKELAEPYLTSGLDRNIPSLFADIKSLYRDPQKLSTVASIAEAHYAHLKAQEQPSPNESEPPTTYLWTLYFLAQHYSYVGQHERALELLDEALSHTPTLPDLHMFKGRVLKRLGDPYGAARCMDEARVLDLQDRFLNTKCGKYRLRAGMNEEAQDVLSLFTKKDAPSPGADLEDMQSVLFLLEDADAYRRNGNLGMALKRYTSIQKLFSEFEDDQFDFHGYSLRKFTINIYLNMIDWAESLRSHPAYVRAAIAASQIYIRLYDDPTLASRSNSSAKMSEEEKKAKKKAKKAASKVQEDPKKPAASSNDDKGLDAGPPKDDDPDGTKLLKADDVLERAAKFLNPLVALAAENIDVWIAIYNVAIRRKKYLQAVQALNRVRALDEGHSELHFCLVHFKKTVSSLPQEPPAPIGPTVSQSISGLLPADVALDTFNSQYLQKYPGSPRASFAFARALKALDAPVEEIESTLFGLLHPEANLDIKTALDALAYLDNISSSRTDEFRQACDSRFERSTIFKAPEETIALRKQAIAPLSDVSATMNGNEDKTEVVS
ncbi:uncharacterized protein PHACADRAFT_253657 [Phanerochaete carnosa HHB-10118-sp]|uniref:N-terminal acetyltransferase A, auxiliary subunit n=1 Tax=Phanerochaete carnosa (strain HHB-10118-sp) TaxID=650164 RepID=K5WBB6_PHACS|nr:uncharacterized protein PHACADRAFT_253657 [Phanerochaete carnosa HHB-10118-sp]EKM56495.1 hypothetical protein PHACADRAFT_253657 [Phanerochaete carnosa HHB-10118-sp]